MDQLVQVLHGEIKTTSLQVAEFFGKNHKDVLKAIKNLECSDGFIGRNFAPIRNDVALREGVSREDVAYEITRDGFAFLGMGFTGKDAATFKEAYIEAFNAMERTIRDQERKASSVQAQLAVEGNVQARQALGVWLRRGLNAGQWAHLYDLMREIAADSEETEKAYNAIHSHFMRYFGSINDVPYDLATRYLEMVRCRYATGYSPEYRNGRLVIEEDLL
jgi:Rha family phage regulatory protein